VTCATVPLRGPRTVLQSWSRFTARHPEWWVVGLAAGAGIMELAGGGAVGMQPAHHASNDAMAAGLWSWSVMAAAMMLPVFVPRARRVARTSIGRIRTRAIAQTLAGYLSVWLAFGIGLLALVPSAGSHPSAGVFVSCWVTAAWWQCTRVRYRVVNRCHAVRCPPRVRDGRRRFLAGISYGGWCAWSCGPAMAATAITGIPAVAMAAVTAGLLAERIVPRPRAASLRLAVAMLVGTIVGSIALLA